MSQSGHALFLYIDQDQMAAVFLEALLGKSFEILALGEEEEGISLLDDKTLDWVIVDFDLPDNGGELRYVKSASKIKASHGFALLSGQSVGVIAWERFHGHGEKVPFRIPMNAQEFLSLFPAQVQEKIS